MIQFMDTATRQKREFVPADPQNITMYVCGPTVYGRAHIGNARPAVVFDTLARLLRKVYGSTSLTYARNITDVDDKIIAAAAAENVGPEIISERFENFYLADMRALGVQDPDLAPHATQEIQAMIDMISALVTNGSAYEAEGHVLFDVTADASYGNLSGRSLDAMKAGARVEIAPYKRNAADFVLWKPSTDGIIGWQSPWGRGRPGWHIECSAMIRRHLGETIDIHGGGLDLTFPHHENEAAQSRHAHGKELSRYWLHNGFVDFGNEKMSKSLGNVVTPGELLDAGHKGEAIRLALLSAHYRQPLPWTESLLEQAKATLDGLYRRVGNMAATAVDQGVIDALSDDLNTPLAIARLSQIKDPGMLKASAQLLGLMTQSEAEWFQGSNDGDEEVNALIEERRLAKANHNYAEADRVRDHLKAKGIILEDTPAGTTWRRA